jgi:hypothetical protein
MRSGGALHWLKRRSTRDKKPRDVENLTNDNAVVLWGRHCLLFNQP